MSEQTIRHAQLPDAGQIAHHLIDQNLPNDDEKEILQDLANGSPPANVTGARNNPEAALANLLIALENLGLITDSTTAA